MGSCPQFLLSYIIFEEKDGKVSFARMAGMAHLKTLSIYFPACLRGKIMDLLFSPNIVFLVFSNFPKFTHTTLIVEWSTLLNREIWDHFSWFCWSGGVKSNKRICRQFSCYFCALYTILGLFSSENILVLARY